ncbi:phage tail tube protein [Phaeacidiphilus oryzae]|uniref:phage tail tube protein n=1 Tax=Phaeacidiphilus oryzae TaxID=348818 RepID=UPI0005620DFC|nr:hypothetical protein [Phaeacidiphilus oryzae]
MTTPTPPAIARATDLSIVGANGGGWVAPAGSASPADPAVQPVSPWAAFGAISDDGLVNGVSEDSTDFTPWGLTAPVRTVITKSVRTFKATLWETANPIAMSLMYRIPASGFTADGQGITSYAETGSPEPDRRAFWFVVLDGSTMRGFYVPQGEVSDRNDITFKQDEMSGYELTITAYPDDAGSTVYHSDRLPVAGGSGDS